MSVNPQKSTDDEIREQIERGTVRVGYVVGTKPDQNKVKLQPVGGSAVDAIVPVTQSGDVALPKRDRDDTLRCYYLSLPNSVPIVLGYVYDSETDPPTIDPGERRVGHQLTDANVFFQADGTITIFAGSDGTERTKVDVTPDGTVVINDGTDAPVTDVSYETDADGHVTSISTTTTDNILV